MPLLSAIFTLSLVYVALDSNINYGLPEYIIKKDFGIIEKLYSGLRLVAPFFLFYSLSVLRRHGASICIGIVFYGIAYSIKRIIWRYIYKFNS